MGITIFVAPIIAVGTISILLLLLIGVTRANATPVPIFGPLDHTYNMTIGDHIYSIRYGISGGNGVVESISANFNSKSITVIIVDNNSSDMGGLFIIELPRNIIDSNTSKVAGGCSGYFPNGTSWSLAHDIDYKILVTPLPKGNTSLYDGSEFRLCDHDIRTLTIAYPAGQTMIEYQGTAMIPEFGSSLSAVVMAVAMVGVTAVSIAAKKSFLSSR